MQTLKEPSKKFIKTPVDLINILTAGGLNQGTITEIYGGNGSGKSCLAYQTASMFLKDNPYGFVTILDCEGSTDFIRFKHTFELDLERSIVKSQDSLETCFESIASIISNTQKQFSSKIYLEDVLKQSESEIKNLCTKNKIELKYEQENPSDPLIDKSRERLILELLYEGIIREKSQLTPHLIIWDSIAASRTRTAVTKLIEEGASGLNAGGMNEKPRLITDKMNIVMSNIVNKPITLLVLNQVSLTGFGSYTGPKEGSSGGNALKHAAHYRFYFHKKGQVLSENKKDVVGTITEITIEKAKFCPKANKTQVFIDDKMGGKIVQKFELALVAKELGILNSSGAWFHFLDENGKRIGRNYRWSSNGKDAYIEGNEEVRTICLDKITRYYRKNYLTVNETYKSLGNVLGDEDVDKRCFATIETSFEVIDSESSKNTLEIEISDADIISMEN